ncbi:hypothetical protein DE146DRAFT_608193 [Phaeosphaeria sp. MPI-PUGE-AT-0046c]|nr:hypothetical protein DE146DRAFT_608193 [Phaeosphaeria sp. MPI-PUGE-AT-0046c]
MARKSTSICKPRRTMRETISYPQIKEVTDKNNSCLNPAMASEHILICGHMINTETPNEPCAPNCHHLLLKQGRTLKIKSSVLVEALGGGKDFYCDACVETEFESKILLDVSSSDAEEQRSVFREAEAKTREKHKKYRKCYIAYKCTAVPCRSDGSISSRYVPSKERHPFDTAMPRTGSNMFENIDLKEDGVDSLAASAGSEGDEDEGSGGADQVVLGRQLSGPAKKRARQPQADYEEDENTGGMAIVAPQTKRRRPTLVLRGPESS